MYIKTVPNTSANFLTDHKDDFFCILPRILSILSINNALLAFSLSLSFSYGLGATINGSTITEDVTGFLN